MQQNVKGRAGSHAKRLVMLIALALGAGVLGAGSTRAEDACVEPPPNEEAMPLPPRPASPRHWSDGSGIGVVLDEQGNPSLDDEGRPRVDGRMTAPQDQRASPYEPNLVAVKVEDSLPYAVETATDMDHWTRADNDNLVCNNNDYGDDLGDASDGVTYNWTASGGSFSQDSSVTTATGTGGTWYAPSAPGRYTLSCRIDDTPTAVQAPQTGERDDTAVVRTVTVVVYRISIYNGSTRLGSDEETKIKAGKLVFLRGVVEPEGALNPSNASWSIGGDIIRNWVHTLNAGYVQQAQLNGSRTQFCWYNRGVNTVTFNVTINDQEETGTTKFKVLKPSGAISGVRGTTQIVAESYGGQTRTVMQNGNPINEGEQGAGIVLDGTVSDDPEATEDALRFNGIVGWLQTGAAIRSFNFTDGTSSSEWGTGLDSIPNRVFYKQQIAPRYYMGDSAGTNLTNPGRPPVLSTNASLTFTTWLMDLSQNVFVPLASIEWNWVAHAERPSANVPWTPATATGGAGTSRLTDSSTGPSNSTPDPSYPSWLNHILNVTVR